MAREERQSEPIQQQAQRLCSEIQLFDLCDQIQCNYKDGRFCTKSELLIRFEHIADEDEGSKVRNVYDGVDESEDDDMVGFGEDDDESFQDEGDWED